MQWFRTLNNQIRWYSKIGSSTSTVFDRNVYSLVKFDTPNISDLSQQLVQNRDVKFKFMFNLREYGIQIYGSTVSESLLISLFNSVTIDKFTTDSNTTPLTYSLWDNKTDLKDRIDIINKTRIGDIMMIEGFISETIG